MRKIDILLNEYGESHQTKMNKNIHFVCVPLIFFSLIGLLASIPVPQTFTNFFPSIVQPYVHLGTFVILWYGFIFRSSITNNSINCHKLYDAIMDYYARYFCCGMDRTICRP